MISLEQGTRLVSLARQAMEMHVLGNPLSIPADIKKESGANQGCFVTLRTGDKLRGCIGYPEPIMPLYEAVASAATNVTYRDHRFPPVDAMEFADLRIEVDILTKPLLLEVEGPDEYLDMIVIGRDGLLLRSEKNTGLLLPQVATRFGWTPQEFLEHTCMKANMPKDGWQEHEAVRVYTFQVEAFREVELRSEVVRIQI